MNINKMKKAELIQALTLQKKDNKELTLKVEHLATQVEKFRATCVELTEANAAIISERDTYKLALDRYLNNTPVTDAKTTKPTKVEQKLEYANAEQCQKDKAAEKNISDHHDKYPTAKQVDAICNVFGNQKIMKGCPSPEVLTSKAAYDMLSFLYAMPKHYRDGNNTKAAELKKLYNISWEEACDMREQIDGQAAYDRLTAKYGKMPTLKFAYKID